MGRIHSQAWSPCPTRLCHVPSQAQDLLRLCLFLLFAPLPLPRTPRNSAFTHSCQTNTLLRLPANPGFCGPNVGGGESSRCAVLGQRQSHSQHNQPPYCCPPRARVQPASLSLLRATPRPARGSIWSEVFLVLFAHLTL